MGPRDAAQIPVDLWEEYRNIRRRHGTKCQADCKEIFIKQLNANFYVINDRKIFFEIAFVHVITIH